MPAPKSTSTTHHPTHEEITARAHRLWIEAGRPIGRDREHWQEAERQLRLGLPPSARTESAATPERH
jgi:hypothetical protein